MHLKKSGSALISSVILLCFVILVSSLMFRLLKNNNEMAYLYEDAQDKFDVNENEEIVLLSFMGKLNEKISEKIENNEEISDVFLEDFNEKIGNSILTYTKKNDKISILTIDENNYNRNRIVKYEVKDNKVILIPTYEFETNYE